jgi:hypothetical protein
MSNYRRGYLVELRALRELERMGYSTFRSAKSRGPFDISGAKDTGILLVQVKREKEPSGDQRQSTPKTSGGCENCRPRAA